MFGPCFCYCASKTIIAQWGTDEGLFGTPYSGAATKAGVCAAISNLYGWVQSLETDFLNDSLYPWNTSTVGLFTDLSHTTPDVLTQGAYFGSYASPGGGGADELIFGQPGPGLTSSSQEYSGSGYGSFIQTVEGEGSVTVAMQAYLANAGVNVISNVLDESDLYMTNYCTLNPSVVKCGSSAYYVGLPEISECTAYMGACPGDCIVSVWNTTSFCEGDSPCGTSSVTGFGENIVACSAYPDDPFDGWYP